MRFNLYLKKHHIEILNNFKKVLNHSIIDDVLNHIVFHVINNEDYEFEIDMPDYFSSIMNM